MLPASAPSNKESVKPPPRSISQRCPSVLTASRPAHQVTAKERGRRQTESGQNGRDHEMEPAFQAGLEETGPHRLVPEVDDHDGQDDGTELFDQNRAKAGEVQGATEDHTEQKCNNRQAEQHDYSPANAGPPTK